GGDSRRGPPGSRRHRFVEHRRHRRRDASGAHPVAAGRHPDRRAPLQPRGAARLRIPLPLRGRAFPRRWKLSGARLRPGRRRIPVSAVKLVVLSAALVIASNVLYHVSQKSIPAGVHPLLSVAVTYAAALLVTLLLWPLS